MHRIILYFPGECKGNTSGPWEKESRKENLHSEKIVDLPFFFVCAILIVDRKESLNEKGSQYCTCEVGAV